MRRLWLNLVSVGDKTIHERILKTDGKDNVVEQKGDLEQGAKTAVLKFEESYFTPYVAHAATETHSAVASKDDRMDSTTSVDSSED